MRIGLLIGFKPKLGAESSWVQLRPGTWRFSFDNCEDTIFTAVARNPVLAPQLNDESFVLEHPTDVKLICSLVGSENHINAYAECLSQ